MGPTETLQDQTAGYYKQLKREGLNPFDLLSWNALVNLWHNVVWAGRNGKYTNQDFQKRTKLMVWSALERKADAINLDRDDEYATDQLLELRNL